MEQGNEKQLIYFKDLLFSVLYQWKKILVFGIALAVLLGAVGVLTQDDSVSVGGLSITPEVQVKVNYLKSHLEALDTSIQRHSDYLSKSTLMTMDPYSVYSYGFSVYVQPLYANPADESATVDADTAALLRAYRSAIVDIEGVSKLAQELGMEHQYLQELLVFDTGSTGYLMFTVRAQELETAQKIADTLLQQAQDSISNINTTVHNHTVKFIPFQSGPNYDQVVADKQTAAYKTLTNYETDRMNIETELKRYAPTQIVADSTSPLVYAIVGGFLGIFLVVAFALVGHLGSEKIYSDRVLANRTGIRVLGCIQSTKKRNFIDLWLRKLEGRATHNSFASVSINIRNRCKDVTTLLIMGNFQADALEDVTTTLEKAGIRCLLCADPAVKADALEALPTCDAVVLAEVCGSSRYDSVEWAMETIADHEKPLLGCILIDG